MKLLKYAVILFIAAGCLDPYNVPPIQSEKQFLVIDGFLTDGQTTIRLSRSMNLAEDVTLAEQGASVQIEAEDGSTYPLTEREDGRYTAATLPVTPGKTYRLRVRTSSNEEYASDYVPFKETPRVDSLFWSYKDGDIDILLNAHDDNGNTRYYMWRYSETWTYQTPYTATVKMVNGVIKQRAQSEFTNVCWKGNPSTTILIGNSARLERDIISAHLINPIPQSSERLRLRYSIEVEQFGLTKEAYEYWQQLKKNTEDIGSIFGPQPSQIASNVHGITNPSELVVGYFSACSIPNKRIFINYADLPPTGHQNPYADCEQDTLFLKDLPFFSGATALITELYAGGSLVGYSTSTYFCVDCTLHNGTTIKPSFWID